MRTPGNKTILLLLAALTALAIAGCGGGGGETETTTPTVEEPTALTKEELIAQGDGICAEVNAAVGALSSPEAAELGGSSEETEKVANLYTGMVERIQDLGAPEGDEGDYAKFMEAAEELAKVEGEVKLAAEREDLEAIGETNGEAEVALEEFHSQAAIYGFEDCSEDPGELPTPATPGGETEVPGEEFEGEEGGVEPEFEEEAAPEEEIAPEEEEIVPETGGAGGAGEEAPEVAPEAGGESGGVGPG